ncbi:MAG: DUF2497 domain-containing protein [Hyphomonadaceae bacterium]|nr:DUF2497 domain-containing protein [Hyphomonadaceae bacterium]
MALQESQAEPSMEEILASIRRIISEDDAGTAAPSQEPVLELSMPAPATAAPAPAPTPAPADDDDLLVFDEQAAPEPVPAPPPPRAAAPAPQPAPQHPDAIMSEPVVSAAAHSFTRLAGSLRLAEQQGQTLEGVVRELLRPMLREWLEQNLPTIVEAKVEAELDRISRLAR